MKKKYIIGYGAGGHAGVLIDTLQDNKEFKIIGLIDNIKKKKAHGFRILGNDNELDNIIKKGIKNVFFGIAGIKNVKRNIKLYNKLESLGFNIVSIIHKSSIISKTTKMDKSIKIFPDVKVNSNVKIGKNVLLNTGCIIEHDCVIGDHAQIGPGAYLGGGVKVKKGSFIGLGARINQQLIIEENSIVGSGSVVTKNIKKNSIVAGVPARNIKKT
jgi:UDP-perosamine 4-acetyltransferase|tara:strand:+ start:176 stop:817 length:642 start_codon:yes stop_codon:yes gene_type:complete